MADGAPFCKNAELSTGNARSGKNAFSLPFKDSYAMDYEILNPAPGRKYQISIWRYGVGESAYLVVSSANADLLYETSKGAEEKDEKGWSKISVTFRVPAGYSENKLKVYLWNTGESPAWFDDFEIVQFK